MKKQTVVTHSGGMDSSTCLALAIKEYGKDNVLSLSFNYSQRHSPELKQAEKICADWQVDHKIVTLNYLNELTKSSLLEKDIPIEELENQPPNSIVIGRNGLMAHLGGIYADQIQANSIYMGIIGVEGNFSGYRDCSRKYMDLKQESLRLDLDNPLFEIKTPLVELTKKETLELAYDLGVLSYLLEHTITCYEGLPKLGCKVCPACKLKINGILDFQKDHPEIQLN